MSTASIRAFRQTTNTCHYCKDTYTPKEMVASRKITRANGGTDFIDNLVVACRYCSNEKGAMNEYMFYGYLKYKEHLRTLPTEELEETLEEVTEILKNDNIENGKRNHYDKPFNIKLAGHKAKAIRYVLKERRT
ncbi:hypothetical protein QCQ60_005302 [Bacillus cereus]|nr:hypothetical protein [Bacillus cereus]